MKNSRFWSQSVACDDADAEYTATLPDSLAQLQLRNSDLTATWRWSFQSGVVATGGTRMAAGEVQAFDITTNPLGKAQPIYVASDTASTSIELAGTILL